VWCRILLCVFNMVLLCVLDTRQSAMGHRWSGWGADSSAMPRGATSSIRCGGGDGLPRYEFTSISYNG
jgi:hypothetical protein